MEILTEIVSGLPWGQWFVYSFTSIAFLTGVFNLVKLAIEIIEKIEPKSKKATKPQSHKR